jgi:type II secretory pathway pseudopilin PulG
MKIKCRQTTAVEGTVLMVIMVLSVILALLMASYLLMVETQSLAVARSQVWNQALDVAEAGVEEGMAQLNCPGVTTNNLATNSWSSLGGGSYSKTSYLGSNYYTVIIDSTNVNPVITATSYTYFPNKSKYLSRTVQVLARPAFSATNGAAILVNSNITFSGFNVTVDSFDSSNPDYSTNGLYDPNKPLDHGDVISISSLSNAIYIGDSKIYGTVHTGPNGIVGYDTAKNAGYSVGDSNYVNSSTVGIESGHDLADATYFPSDVTLPNVMWSTAAGGAKYKVNGVMFDYVLDNTANWQVSSLSSSVYVNSPGTVLYVTGSVSLGSGTEIYIAPGASFTLYVGGASASIGGQGVLNTSGLARNFTYYGLPSNTSFGLQANASFTGVIYAPEAYVSIGGGGSSTYDFQGQIIANSMKMNGHFNVHYDQNLGSVTNNAGYRAYFWAEL